MLPPRRYTRRHWCCATCGAELGRIRHSTEGSRLLFVTDITAARKTGERTWLLTCKDGHDTAWSGDQLNWWEVPRAA